MRYFLKLSYLGTAYCGWQRQPNARTVQQTIEEAISMILRTPTQILGCGRTDTGVHASTYYAHFDAEAVPKRFLYALNAILPDDIAISEVLPLHADAHARFDATLRSYIYFIDTEKNPFAQNLAWQYPQGRTMALQDLQAAADILMDYEDFYTFCKSDNNLNTFKVQLKEARWEYQKESKRFVFHISGNRFLRGMVRLVVGGCVQVAKGQIELGELRTALDKQIRLPKPLSVPAEGLFLCRIEYPFLSEVS